MARPVAVVHPTDAEPQPLARDRAVAALFEGQHHVAARWQLEESGVGRGAIARWVERKRLFVVYRGVYCLTSKPSVHGRWMAAVLAGGAHAALSHRAAGALQGIRPSKAIEITVPTARHRRAGLTSHRSKLPPDELTEIDGIPVTTLPRTLLDLAAVLPCHQLEKAINEAEVQRLGDARSLTDIIDRYPNRKGTAALRGIRDAGLRGRTRSPLEDRFVAFCRREDVSEPERNTYVEGYECDCVWPGARLIVELDGRAAHDTRSRFEHDRLRDDALAGDLRQLTARSYPR